ncbi:ATP-binding protein [Acidiphilium sp.]|uniref:ATP-binding protein n=1 Tax=Acidiphilium sp. TaxID=527 RepID=UPI003D0390D4
MRAIAVHDGSQVAEARRYAVTIAHALEFGETDAGRVAIVATELASNLIKHGKGGTLLVGDYHDGTGSGVECIALDRGPGIGDIEESLRDGHSTAGSAGNGLGAIQRIANTTEIYTRVGSGTAILARLNPSQPSCAKAPMPTTWGAVSVPIAGEDICGDVWLVKPQADGFLVVVADGLGHGPLAAEAGEAAVLVCLAEPAPPLDVMIARMHAALRPTRGAAVAVAEVDSKTGTVNFVGIGNVAGALITSTATRRMVSHNGIIGHVTNRVQVFTYGFTGAPLVVLCSDGVGTSWNLNDYPGLSHRHPSLIAGVLYRDFNRGRDDATIVVARGHI